MSKKQPAMTSRELLLEVCIKLGRCNVGAKLVNLQKDDLVFKAEGMEIPIFSAAIFQNGKTWIGLYGIPELVTNIPHLKCAGVITLIPTIPLAQMKENEIIPEIHNAITRAENLAQKPTIIANAQGPLYTTDNEFGKKLLISLKHINKNLIAANGRQPKREEYNLPFSQLINDTSHYKIEFVPQLTNSIIHSLNHS